MNRLIAIASLCGLVCTVVSAAGSELGSASGEAEAAAIERAMASQAASSSRDQLVLGLRDRWATHVQKVYGVGLQEWVKEFAVDVARATDADLRHATSMDTFLGMTAALTGQRVTDAQLLDKLIENAARGSKTLGDSFQELVYNKIVPCRIADTRIAGGAIAAGAVRSFDVTAVTDYTFQGGRASDCNGVGAAGNFAALAVNVSVINPPSAGSLTVFPFLATQPNAISLSYQAGVATTTGLITALDQGPALNELSIFSTANTDIVIDVVGYFINPVLAPLDCEEKNAPSLTVGPGATVTSFSPACSAGFNAISGGCTSSSFDGRVVSSRTFTGTNTHFCAFRNEGTGSMQATTYAVCCKLPSGR